MRQRISRTDANHAEVLAAARAAGCSVVDTHVVGQGFPDCVVGLETERGLRLNLLVEIKQARGKLNERERRFVQSWHGQYVIVRSAQEMIDTIEAIRGGR